ncbi:MAG: hypothetical protein A2Y17_10350 [Clostridiales bacterium GWF2_38_85]|nr:MAG: hypothetical protein A2Y17_10350 [Clostridiales bacterium GWF2_38_85]HBL84862.1 hypothetical protein [Clostridiales bacterium]
MIKIGTVNIDTSHPHAFAEYLLKGGRARYTEIYNDAFRTDAEVDAFVAKYDLKRRRYSLDEMAKSVDIALIQGCDWDKHLALAEPFIKAGKPVFIDKPIAGRLSDLEKFEVYAKSSAVILGSSSMRYTFEHQEFFAKSESERGKIVHISATVGVDEFNYAIHAVESILGLTSTAKPVSTEYIGNGITDSSECDSFFVKFDSGITATYHICTPAWQPSTLTIVTTKTTFPIKIDSSKVYEAMLDQLLNYLEGKDNIIATTEQLCDSVRIMLAGKKSKLNGGDEVKIADLKDEMLFDGAAFEKFYESQQRK